MRWKIGWICKSFKKKCWLNEENVLLSCKASLCLLFPVMASGQGSSIRLFKEGTGRLEYGYSKY